MNNKWLILLDLSLQLYRAGSYFMWKTLLMKAFQPLASSSNNILDLPCQQTCLETWLPCQTWQKHYQVQKTNWWAFWKGTTRGRNVSVMFHSKRKLFRRKNRRLFAVFVHYDKNLPFHDRSKYWNGGKGSPVFSRIWSGHPSVLVPTQADTEPPPVSRAHSLCVTAAGDGDACPGGTAMSTKLHRWGAQKLFVVRHGKQSHHPREPCFHQPRLVPADDRDDSYSLIHPWIGLYSLCLSLFSCLSHQ